MRKEKSDGRMFKKMALANLKNDELLHNLLDANNKSLNAVETHTRALAEIRFKQLKKECIRRLDNSL